MKDKKMLLGIGIAFLFLATIGFTYAWFSSAIIQNDVKNQVVTTGTLSLRYVDGPEIKMENIRPGQTITKTVYVANTGTLDVSYNLVWQELVNEISNDEMVLESICTRMNGETEVVDGSCDGIESSPIGDNIIKKNVSIEPNIVHKYDITITFKEINAAQNYNQNKKFNGVIGIEEYNGPTTANCFYDGEPTEGAVFTKGIYTYKYKEHKAFVLNMGEPYGIWNELDADGWGVAVEFKNYLEEVNEAPCAFINDVPVLSMSGLFLEHPGIKRIDVSQFNTSNVINMDNMFSYLLGLEEISGLDNLDTSNVTSMKAMFYKNGLKTINLDGFNTSKVTDMSHMFSNCPNLTTIYSGDGFITTNVSNSSNMFGASYNLVGGAGTTYDSTKTDKTYARIDGEADIPGYFTSKDD